MMARIQSVDALRGIAMLLMLLDHVREYFFLHRQVSDPMALENTEASLFVMRFAAHLCPVIFVFLSGSAIWLYAQRHNTTRRDLAVYLLRRGAFLVLLELTVVNFAWTFQFPPSMIYLQVIWAIGLCMMAMAGLVLLPVPVLWLLFGALVAGHNLLDPIAFTPDSPFYLPWAILHDRSTLVFGEYLKARTSYPILPWLGLMGLGYLAARWFSAQRDIHRRMRITALAGCALLLAFALLRGLHGYGAAHDWQVQDGMFTTLLAILNVTKYPPSLHYLLLCGGMMCLLLALLQQLEQRGAAVLAPLSVFGKAPLFFYLLHLYVLHLLYHLAIELWGLNQGERFGFDSPWGNLCLSFLLIPPLYFACRAFIAWRKNTRNPLVRML
jgi:uncharacterized membrane protein